MQETILLIDDDEMLAGAVVQSLSRRGASVLTATTGSVGRQMIDEEAPDLVVLDLMLPDEDGIDICRDLRLASDIPIVILSGRWEETDRIMGLEAGADDYVAKPFSLAELGCRIRAVLRRSGREPGQERPVKRPPAAQGIEVDEDTQTVSVNGKDIELTPTEYKLLVELMQRNGDVLSNKELIAAVWGTRPADSRTLAVHIRNLRSKLADAGVLELVTNLRGFGYRFG